MPSEGLIQTATARSDNALSSALIWEEHVVRPRSDLATVLDPRVPGFFVLAGIACREATLRNGRACIVAYLLPGEATEWDVGPKGPRFRVRSLTAMRLALLRPKEGTRSAYASLMDRAHRFEARVAQEWVMNNGARAAPERLAHHLCEFYVRLRNAGLTVGGSCSIPLSQRELGEAVGLSAVHVNRTLRELKQRGLLTLAGGVLTIRNFDAVAAFADFDAGYLDLSPRHSGC